MSQGAEGGFGIRDWFLQANFRPTIPHRTNEGAAAG